MRRASLAVTAIGALAALGGCQMLGPGSIGLGRDRYNSIIQSTSMEQTMSNIVRVYNHEPTLFMDVTEVDATVTFGGSLNGTVTNIGSRPGATGGTLAGQVGGAGGAVQYSETPTIRYQPLLGQALVAQLVTPVSVDALGLLYDSSWDIAPLLDFSAAYLTLDYREFYPALNTIDELGHKGAIELAASRSGLPTDATRTAAAPGAGKPPSSDNDSLVIYLRPFHHYERHGDLVDKQRILQLWVRMFRIYAANQPAFAAPTKCKAIGLSLDVAALRDWDVNIATHVAGTDDQQNQILNNARDCLPSTIELRVVPLPLHAVPPGITSYAPLMRTYSALGILKNATERPGPKIEFVTPEQYRHIRDDAWNQDVDSLSYYTLLPSEEDSVDCPDARKQQGGCDSPASRVQLTAEIDRWIQASAAPPAAAATAASPDPYPSGLDVYETAGKDVLANKYIDLNGRLGTLRRYILIVVDDHLPQEPVYVSYTDGRRWYYIAKDDAVSEKNFQLLALFMTMMAVPPSTQPLSPVINVGGG